MRIASASVMGMHIPSLYKIVLSLCLFSLFIYLKIIGQSMEQIYLLLLVIYPLYNCVRDTASDCIKTLNRDHTEACS